MKPDSEMNMSPKERIGRMLGRVWRNRFQLSELMLEQVSIGPGQVPILHELGFHGEMTQRELAEHTHVTAATISGTLKRMEKAGLVYRTDDEKDARISIVRLTDEGKARGELAGELFVKADMGMLEGFTDDECEVLMRFLNRMQENLLLATEAQEKLSDRTK